MGWFANYDTARLRVERDDATAERDAAAHREDGDESTDATPDEGPIRRPRSRWRLFKRRAKR